MMPRPVFPPAQPPWLRLPRPTARLRLTLFYASLFLVSGAGLLAITYALMGGGSLGFTSTAGGQDGLASPSPAGLASTNLHTQGLSPQQVLERSAAALAVMAAASVVLGWVVAGRVLRPVRTITATARGISAGSLHERIAIAGPDDEFRNSATRSITCSAAWSLRSTPSAASWLTPPTNCAPR